MKTFKELRENLIIEKVTHTTLSAVKSILPAGHVLTHEESNDDTKIKHNDIIVSRNAKHKEHARFRATSDTGGGDITLASYTSREPEHVAIAAHEAHHALIHHKLKGQGALHSNEHIVNKMTRNWIDKNYVGNDRARAHAAVAKSEASYKDHLPGQIVQQHRSERAVKEATYKGKEVSLNKPMAGDVKKSKVFVDLDGDGKATKVNFGDKNMTIKKHIPARRRSFRARHNCDTPGPKDKARYWSCRAW